MIRAAILFAVWLVFTSAAFSETWSAHPAVKVCPAAPEESGPPDFSAERCRTALFWRADPQGRTIWIEARIELEAAPDPLSGPHALFLSGKMAAEASVNGAVIGANGAPGFNRAEETPGLMDAALFLPTQLLRAGENRVVLKASGHHSVIPLAAPIHRIEIGPYSDPRRSALRGYQGSLVTLGVFALALIFFTLLAALTPQRAAPALLAVIAFTGAGQLLAEAGRGLFAYTYPVHDLRLMALAAGAAVLALSVTAWSALRFAPQRKLANRLLVSSLLATVVLILVLGDGVRFRFVLIRCRLDHARFAADRRKIMYSFAASENGR